MVKANKNLKKKQADEEALKLKLLESMKLSFQDPNDSDEDESDEEVEDQGMEVGEDSDSAEQEDGEDEDEEDDDEEDEVKGEESDEDDNEVKGEETDEDEGVAALDKTVYEESDEDEDEDEEEEDYDDEEPEEEEDEKPEPVKPTKSKGPVAKKAKLEVEKPEPEESDDDDEVTEEPIKRDADIPKALKRKMEKVKKAELEKETNFQEVKVEELPLTCFILNVPHNLGKKEISQSLKSHTDFQRIFFQGAKKSNQPFKFYVVFENKDQMEKAMETEITLNNPKKPTLTAKKIKLVPTKWTIFNSLSGHIVCVKGLTKNVTENDLKTKFEEFGEVLKIELVTQTQGNALKFPFSYIFFKTVESSSKAVETANVEICNVKVDIQAYHIKNAASDEKSAKLEPQGKPVTMEECPRTLYIANANKFSTHKDIEELLSKYGEINRVLSQIQSSQGKPAAKFFKVIFNDVEGFTRALKANKLTLGKKTLLKSPIKWNTLPELHSHMVKVSGIPVKCSKEDLETKFKTFGKVANVEIFKPKKRDNAVAFVFFESVQSAKKAVSLDGTDFQGQKLSVHQRQKAKDSANTIFIKKPSSKAVTKEVLEKALQKFGPIHNIHDGMKNFVVSFKKPVDAKKALNTKVIKVEGVTLELGGHNAENSNKSLGVLVTGCSKETTIDEILEHFKECGDIIKNYIGSSKRASGARSTFVYLEFAKPEDKTKALKLSKTSLNGKFIYVKNSKPRA